MEKNELHKNTGYILYVDILGYKEILNSGDETDISTLKKFIHDLQPVYLPTDNNLFNGCDKNKFHIRYFSDNILIFYQSINEDLSTFIGMVYLANYIQSKGITAGFMTRGSLSYGNIEHNGKIVFGKSIIDSYELEKNNPFPSICLSPSLKDYALNHSLSNADSIISPFGYFHDTDSDAKKWCLSGLRKMINRLNHQIQVDERILSKYDWLVEEYNRYFRIKPIFKIVRMPSAIYQIVKKSSERE